MDRMASKDPLWVSNRHRGSPDDYSKDNCHSGKSPKEEVPLRAKRWGVLFEVEIKFIHIVIGKYYVSPHCRAVVVAAAG